MVDNQKVTAPNVTKDAKFGTFKGVFTPSILTILGVIMYLRFGWVVGNAGMLGAIAIVLLAHVISLTTGLSLSSIATNRTVKAGGDYYMISRSLGLPIGGALGLALFFALAFSTSLYLLGFAETFLDAFGLENTLFNRRLVGSISCAALTAITFFSTSLALRIQYLVLAAIVLSLISLFIGKSSAPPDAGMRLWFGEGSESFETVFAVFFPAVTGFTAGVAMSGDLKDPRRSIPRGTIAAILVGLVVYLVIPVFLTFNVDHEALRQDKLVWMRVARVPHLITAGVFAATLSSALGSMLGGPRYLQALALDSVVPRFLGKGHGPLNEPRIATAICFMVAEAGILVGELDLIARIVTMFFLTSYGFLCLAAGIQTWSGVSSYRPDFKIPAWVSFVGAVTCLGVMFKLDMVALIAATVVMGAIAFGIKRRQLKTSPKDTWGGFWAAVAQKAVLRLQSRTQDSQSWRPNVVVFGGDPLVRPHMIKLARWLFEDRGMATYFDVVEGDVRTEIGRVAKIEPEIRDTVARLYPEMLTRVTVSQDAYTGIRHAAQIYGLSGMTPNTVLMGWGEESKDPEQFTELVRDLLALDHNLLFLEYDDNWSFGNKQTIDIWWGGMERNVPLMLLVAYLITSTDGWAQAKVRVNVIVDENTSREETTGRIKDVLGRARVKAEPNVIVRSPGKQSIADIIHEVSGRTDLVILGLASPVEGEGEEFVRRVSSFIDQLGTVILVRASGHFEGEQVLFDDP
jgi:solute carrier family 12 sodium/potassium/chloride transporter 2